MENPINMDDLGGFPIFLETPIWLLRSCHFFFRYELKGHVLLKNDFFGGEKVMLI